MRHRFLSLAVLAGIALALLAPVQPAMADNSCSAGYDCVDCSQVFVSDPSFCMDSPPPSAPSNPERGGMQEMPGGPGMRPGETGEVCINERNFADPAFIIQSGQQPKKIYTFTVRVNFCTQNGVVTRASVIPGLEREPFDPRVMSITFPTVFLGPNGQGTPFFEQGQDVLTEFCPDRVNCTTYRHTIFVEINAAPSPGLKVSADLFPCTPGNGC